MPSALALSLIAMSLGAAPEEEFERLKSRAEAVGGLGAFLEAFVGDCPAALEGGQECAQKAAQFRKRATGKPFFMHVGEDSSIVSMGGVDGDQFTLNVTPFFGAGNSAVTQGAPTRTDGKGNPILPHLRVAGVLPEGVDPSMVGRWAATRGLSLQVLFTPTGLWQLPAKGGKRTTGVKAKISGLLVTVSRTGQVVGAYVAR